MLPAPTFHGPPRVVCATGATLGEGLCWSPRGHSLYWVDILSCRLYRYTPASQALQFWAFDETVSAVAERRSSPGLVITLRHGFATFDPATGELTRLATPEADRPGNRFNDGKCDAQGRFWAGTMDFDCEAPTGALYRLDGRGRCTLAFDARMAVTNGPAWSPDGRTMYFNDTVPRRTLAFDIEPLTAALGPPRLWRQWPASEGHPDGMTVDALGRLWVAHWGGACVSCHDPSTTTELARITLPTDHITNVCFGGADLSTLYITSARFGLSDTQLAAQPLAGSVFAVDTDVRGLPAHLHAS